MPDKKKPSTNSGGPPPPPPSPPPPSNTSRPRNEHRFPVFEHYVDPSNNFFAGQRDGSSERDQAVARYLQDWEDAWRRSSQNSNNSKGDYHPMFFDDVQALSHSSDDRKTEVVINTYHGRGVVEGQVSW